jgi:DNA modification methylase
VKPYLLLRADDLDAQRPRGEVDDVHFTEALAASVLADTTAPGDVVLDPFAGYGTTLVVAERMERTAIGVELLPDHVDLVRSRTAGLAVVLQGDSRDLATVVADVLDGPVDLVLTSPPYMSRVAHPENPLTGYATDDGDYPTYLSELGQVFAQVAELLRRGGHAVVNVANVVTRHEGADGSHDTVTPLAWDVGRVVAQHLTFEGETFLCWDRHPPGLAGDYLLWFRKQ